jgi:ABC-type transport system involved in multi-copper enzyme maturation permease subunit
MFSLPMVRRELGVAARRNGTYSLRAAAALGAMVIGGFIYAGTAGASQSIFGQTLFGALSGLAMFFCLAAGVRLTADCLSEEKREGTLGLLFLTDLKGHDIVFGKLAATSLSGLYGLLAIFPVLALPLLAGGTTNAEFWRMALVLVNAFLFSLAIGMFTSSLSRQARPAMGAAFLLILFFTAFCPAFATWIKFKSWSNPMQEFLFLPCPTYSFHLSPDLIYRSDARGFWWSVATIHSLTWLFLLLACFVVPRSWRDQPAGPGAAGRRERRRALTYGGAAFRNSFRKRLLEVNAYYWLAARAHLKPAWVWALFILPVAAWAWGYEEFADKWFNPATFLLTAVALNSAIKIWVASESGRRLAEDRRLGALELLLTTPLGVRDILRGQLLALRRQFLGPILVLILVELAPMIPVLQRPELRDDERLAFVWWWIAGLILLVADTVALSWVGMWMALSAKNPNQVAGAAFLRVLVLPCCGYAVLMAAFRLGLVTGVLSQQSWTIDWKFFLGSWLGLRLLNDLFFGLEARRRLLTRFRARASREFKIKN